MQIKKLAVTETRLSGRAQDYVLSAGSPVTS